MNQKLPHFSKVVTDLNEAMSIRFNNTVYDLQRQGKPVTVMSLGEAFFELPLFDFASLPYPKIFHYSHSRGLPELREKLAQYYEDSFSVEINPDREILITSGSKAAIYMALTSILSPGEEVLVPEPAWVSYPEQIRLCHAVPVGIPYQVGPESYHEYITPRTKAIIINSPHNPRGYIYKKDQLENLLALAQKHNLWLLGDEAYSDFVIDGTFQALAELDPRKENTITFNSVSKNFGMSGWRLGYVIGHQKLIDQILKVNQHIITCPATILQYYVAEYFEKIREIVKPQISNVVKLRDEMIHYTNGLGLHSLEGTGTFYFFLSIRPSKLKSEEFCFRLLNETGVCVVPGVGYGSSCDEFVRVSVGTLPQSELKKGFEHIKKLILQTS